MTTLVIAIASITPGSASAAKSSMPVVKPNKAQRSLESASAALVLPLRHGVAERRTKTWEHQDALGEQRWPTTYRELRTHSVPYLRWLHRLWAQRADKAYRKVISGFFLKDFQVRPSGNAWLSAVSEAQRPYPNTDGWLLACSSQEGGHGRWVPNSQGSGAGGWLQFMSSTFWRMFSAARADVTSRGYKVPASAASWYSPLGQALAGGWAATHGATHEWSGASC